MLYLIKSPLAGHKKNALVKITNASYIKKLLSRKLKKGASISGVEPEINIGLHLCILFVMKLFLPKFRQR